LTFDLILKAFLRFALFIFVNFLTFGFLAKTFRFSGTAFLFFKIDFFLLDLTAMFYYTLY